MIFEKDLVVSEQLRSDSGKPEEIPSPGAAQSDVGVG
jgi:hypothetical protein